MNLKSRIFKITHEQHVFSADSVRVSEEGTELNKGFSLDLDPESWQAGFFGKADEAQSFLSFLEGVCIRMVEQVSVELCFPASLAHQVDLIYRDIMRVFSPGSEPVCTMECEECGPYLLHNSFESRLHITLTRPEDRPEMILIHLEQMHENFKGE